MIAQVTVVGSINIDTVITVQVHPLPGETVLGQAIATRPGGKGANQAIAAAAAGATTLLVAAIGQDQAGLAYRQGLADRGVDITHIRQSPTAATGRAHVTVNGNGENSIIVLPGANLDLNAETVVTALHPGSRVLLTQLETPEHVVAAALRRARELGVVSILNASPVTGQAVELAALADIVVVNEHEHHQLGSQPNACVTLGARGATWEGHTVAPPPTTVVDTTGAGDVFAGTIAAHLALGTSHSAALCAAVKASALATTTTGAQPWLLPTV